VVCSHDGMTYFIDHTQNVVRYKFPERCVDALSLRLSVSL
jgi:hypothetical protein